MPPTLPQPRAAVPDTLHALHDLNENREQWQNSPNGPCPKVPRTGMFIEPASRSCPLTLPTMSGRVPEHPFPHPTTLLTHSRGLRVDLPSTRPYHFRMAQRTGTAEPPRAPGTCSLGGPTPLLYFPTRRTEDAEVTNRPFSFDLTKQKHR
jgi:hypothetical protein